MIVYRNSNVSNTADDDAVVVGRVRSGFECYRTPTQGNGVVSTELLSVFHHDNSLMERSFRVWKVSGNDFWSDQTLVLP